MIERTDHGVRLLAALRRHPVVALLGARQVGRSTLAEQVAARSKGPVTKSDLERPRDLVRLEDAEPTLSPLEGLVVLGEVQRRPRLFPLTPALLRVRSYLRS